MKIISALRHGLVILLLFPGSLSLLLSSCAKKPEPIKKPPVAVTVGRATQRTVPLQITAIGNVEAYSSIQVKSQIGGELVKVHFREGQDVNKGALLFTIDPRPYQALIKQSEATLARDIAQLEYAREEARRYATLSDKGYVAKDQYEQFKTTAATAEATVNADRAALENARLQLKYCYIYSPISGKTGNLNSNQGNLIKANADTAMVAIQQIQPVYVSFSVPEQRLADIKKYMALGQLKVEAMVPTKDGNPAKGVLTFIDNIVDMTTGTIKMKGTFANGERSLWPGQFVNIVLTLSTEPNAVLAPTAAIQTGQKGQFVFVVKEDNTVDMRPVVVDRAFGDDSVISQGLKPGEVVVTDGQLRLTPGAKVEVKSPVGGQKEQAPAQTPGSSPAAGK